MKRKKGKRLATKTIDDALDRYWISSVANVPDYGGLGEWFTARFEAQKRRSQVPIHAAPDTASVVDLLSELVESCTKAGVKITPVGGVPDGERFALSSKGKRSLKSLNRAKLLLYLLNEVISERMRETLSKWTDFQSGSIKAQSVLQASSQFEHRAAFFSAVETGQQHLAFKMLGRLREEEHDPGEIEFLESYAAFRSNRFVDAISLAKQISRDALDWSRAFMLICEAHAYLGRIDSIESEIRSEPGFTFPALFLPYICQVVVKNSSDPENCFEKAVALLSKNGKQSGRSESNVYQLWNRHSCDLAVQHIEQRQAHEESKLAGAHAGDDIDYWKAERSLRARQVDCAFYFDPFLSEAVSASKLSEAYKEVMKRLLNTGDPGMPEFIQGFTTLWRVGDRSEFLRSVLRNLPQLVSQPNPRLREVLVWAYQEAIVERKDADMAPLKQALTELDVSQDTVDGAVKAATASRLEVALSPMGKTFLELANWDLRKAEYDGSEWRDAGMISLGFFRILELEFNERLILPAVQSMDFLRLAVLLGQLKSAAPTAKQRRASEFWTESLKKLQAAHAERRGLELGPLHFLLGKIRETSGIDSELKRIVGTAIQDRLSDAGITALQTGELANLLAEEPRERFRNPAAHNRFVDLGTARDAKAYVESALWKLVEFTRPSDEPNPTVH